MTPSFPTIVHVDGDAFFASCESARDPRLLGKPVVVGRERGIASAFSYEAKARGVFRGMPIGMVRRVCPEAVILPGDYDLYATISRHLFHIMRQHIPVVETYGIDEGFGDFIDNTKDHFAKVVAMRDDIHASLGLTVSVGLSHTKVLSKVASKTQKPHGLTLIPQSSIEQFLATVPVEKIWGVGRQTVVKLYQMGVKTALDLYTIPVGIIRSGFSRPMVDLWFELHGECRMPVSKEKKDTQASISKTKTFSPTKDTHRIFGELVHNIEAATRKARQEGVVSGTVSLFLKDQAFRYAHARATLLQPTAFPGDIIRAVRPLFQEIFDLGTVYRSSGVVLSALTKSETHQTSLFTHTDDEHEDTKHVWQAVDRLTSLYGEGTVELGSSLVRRARIYATGQHGSSERQYMTRREHTPTIIGGVPVAALVV